MALFVYVLINPGGETYVGQTSDLDRRLTQHNDPSFRGTLHTKRHHGPWHVLHWEKYATRTLALARERELKTGKGRDFIARLKAGRPGSRDARN